MPIRVLIVEDSPTQRLALTRMIESSPELIVCGLAVDGEQAVQMAERLRPDVISMDVQMPRLSGPEATRQIMRRCPTPIVIVSAISASPDALDALQAGALAIIDKPPAPNVPEYPARCAELVLLLQSVAALSPRHQPSIGASPIIPDPLRQTGPLGIGSPASTVLNRPAPVVVGIGASAGGPGALATLLGRLPADFPLPILIVQHLARDFMPGLAEWLDRVCPLTVRLAEAGDLPARGTVYVAPGNRQLRVGTDRRLMLDSGSGAYRHCPAVDALFESLAVVYGAQSMGIILTGMGDDGAAGLRLIREAGGHTLAEAETSCVVFGMPAAAIARGAVETVLPLSEIGGAMQRLAGRHPVRIRQSSGT